MLLTFPRLSREKSRDNQKRKLTHQKASNTATSAKPVKHKTKRCCATITARKMKSVANKPLNNSDARSKKRESCTLPTLVNIA